MNRVAYVKPDFPVDAFAGTATYSVRYRVPYPAGLLQDLLARAGITGEGRLLDLACGPGRIALALVSSFREVWAIDREAEMVEVGQQEARQRGVHNITWLVGKAEDLQAPPASCALLTIGEAFHRLDQQRVAQHTLQWLQPGGCVAILGGYGLISGKEPWQHLVAEIVRHWTRHHAIHGDVSAPPQPGSGPDHNERVLRATGFVEVASYPFVAPHDWSIETIIGNLYSTSFCSKRVLGNNAAAFEAELKATLLAHDPSGTYREQMRFGYTIGRKPTCKQAGGASVAVCVRCMAVQQYKSRTTACSRRPPASAPLRLPGVAEAQRSVLCIRTHEMTGDLRGHTDIGVATFLLRHHDSTAEVLLLRRATRRFFRHWFPIEGRIEVGETPEQAALREVREETRIYPAEFFREQREPVLLVDLGLSIYVFVGFTHPSAQVVLNDEHSAFAWVNPTEVVLRLPLPSQRAALRRIYEHFVVQQPEEMLRVF